MNAPRLALRFLLRDWRAGELRLLALAVVLAVAAVSSVSWLAERVGAAQQARAAELLAADRAVSSREPIPEDWLAQARELGLAYARTAEFPSVVLVGEQTQLVAVKAVEQGYPLRGSLRIQASPEAAQQQTAAIPEPGTVWLEPRLLAPLQLAVGGSLSLGQSTLRAAALVALEPDRGGFFISLAPRVLMNWQDLAATELIQPGSRVRYQLLLAGPEPALKAFERWLDPESRLGVEWRLPAEGQPGVEETLARGQRFLGLSALLTVVVAGIAMLLTVRRYAARQLDRVAVMRCLGASQAQVAALLVWKLFWLGLAAGAVGLLAGYLLQALMLALVADLLPAELPAPGLLPALTGWLTAAASLLGFALPTVLRLRQVPPLRVLRRDLGGTVLRGLLPYPVALAVIFALMWWQARDLELAALVFGAVLATLAVLALSAWGLVLALRSSRRRRLLWLSGITRRPATAAVQIMGVGLGLMALFLLTVVRGDLLSAWEGRIAADAPNYFLINVQPAQAPELREFIGERFGVEAHLQPMVRGRLVAINERAVRPDDYEEARAQRLVAREFNLSWAGQMGADNRIAAGRWWGEAPAEPGQWSVEEGLAQSLGIKLGDTLHFSIAGEDVSATVTSLRKVDWDSFNVNFFVLAPPGLLEPYPATYITSFHLPSPGQGGLAELVRRFPGVTVIDIGSILATARGLIDQGARVVKLMATLTLLAGLLVLLAALQITGEERRFESALMRALGASRRRIQWLAWAEFWLLGATAGLLAGLMAALTGHILAAQLFDLRYPVDPWVVLVAALCGALVVWLAGALGTRRFYKSSPGQLLRSADEAG